MKKLHNILYSKYCKTIFFPIPISRRVKLDRHNTKCIVLREIYLIKDIIKHLLLAV